MDAHSDRERTTLLAEAAMVVALSIALGNLRVVELPAGGSVSFGSLPLLAFAALRGVRAGCTTGWCAGVGHALAGGMVVHPLQFVLDYGAGYAVLGLAGMGRRSGLPTRKQLLTPVLVAQTAQLGCFALSGAWFFAPSGAALGAAASFAIVYNLATVLPETALAIWLVPRLVRAYAVACPALMPRAARTMQAPKPEPVAPRIVLGLAEQLRTDICVQNPTATLAPRYARATTPHRPAPFARPPLFRQVSSRTNPSGWRTRQPQRDFAR